MKAPHNSDSLIEQLRDRRAFPDDTTTVKLIETHISWVLLTDRFVYKIKKPVRFDFLDFSTLPLRHEACLREQELNQRLAPHVYLGVVPITRDSRGRLAVKGDGEVVEWAVRMRRLPDTAALDQRLLHGELAPHELRRLAEFLCQFYDRQPPVQVLTDEYHQAVLKHVRGNRQELLRPEHSLDSSQVLRIHSAQLRFLFLQDEVLDNRVRDGRIVEGHGDLRPEHIYLTPRPVVIDCIEFSYDLRQLDVVDELGFLAMECDRLGAPEVGNQILRYYQDAAQDHVPAPLLAFYKSYRAAVRAKVSVLRSLQLSGAERQQTRREAAEYLELADRYAREIGPPLVLLVHGRSGVGKSTVAAALGDTLGLEHLQTDLVRRELFFRNGNTRLDSAELYSPENRQKVYDQMAKRANELLNQRVSIVLDGTFLSGALRDSFRKLADSHGANWLAVHCSCPLEVARQRIVERRESGPHVSDAWPELPAMQHETESPSPDKPDLSAAGSPASYELDTRAGLSEMVQQVLTELRTASQPVLATR
jgi:uncharacterized protein